VTQGKLKVSPRVKILEYGTKRLKINGSSVSAVLGDSSVKELSQTQLSAEIGCSVQALRYHLRKSGLLKNKLSFVEKIKEMGFKDTKSFFKDKEVARKTFKDLAVSLCMSYATVSKNYKEFLKTIQGEHHEETGSV
jgi:hypothetical protein